MGTYDPKWDVQDIEAVNKEQRKGWEAIHVTEQYYVRTVDVQTGEETISEPRPWILSSVWLRSSTAVTM